MVDFLQLAKKARQSLSPEKRAYLHGRGINDSTIKRFYLGELTEPFPGVPDYLVGCITIPYILKHQPLDVRKVRFRTFWDKPKPKYIDLEHEKPHLYNLQPTLTKTMEYCVYMCEGEMDALIMEQMGYPTIAVPGAQSFNGNWRFLFSGDFEVVLVFDGDEAGRHGAHRIKSIIGTLNDHIRTVWLPDGKDITDVYCSLGGRKTLRELLG